MEVESQANAVVLALQEWGLVDKVVGMSFDTTASNTGRKNGTFIHIEAKLKQDLSYFTCRHHGVGHWNCFFNSYRTKLRTKHSSFQENSVQIGIN